MKKETVLDAACLGLLKVGELINRAERMQHEFWQDFSAAHFLDLRRIRNLIGHTDDLEGERVIPLGTGIVQDLLNCGTLFPETGSQGQRGFLFGGDAVLNLEPTCPGDKPSPDNPIAMIELDEKHRFVIIRVGRSADNKMLIWPCATGNVILDVCAVDDDPGTDPTTPHGHE